MRDISFRGCSAAASLFNPNGIILFDSIDELDREFCCCSRCHVLLTDVSGILQQKITRQGFESRREAVHDNAKKVTSIFMVSVLVVLVLIMFPMLTRMVMQARLYSRWENIMLRMYPFLLE
jgi:hypothetical protein